MSRRRPLRPDEQRLWAHVAKTVRPYPGRKASLPHKDEEPPPASSPAAGISTRHGAGVRAKGPGPLAHNEGRRAAPDPADRSGEKRVRRGRVEIGGRLDLHGMTQVEARAALVGFVHAHRRDGARCVLVITGKGRQQDHADRLSAPEAGGVLRRRLPEWLAEPDLRAFVTGFAPAHARHGGYGAWYVFLKAP